MQKFRAFCKRHKCIEEVFQITYLGDNDIKVEAECLSGYVGSDFILMQSTGLYDSTKFEDLSEKEQKEWLESGKIADEWQGREIFEGDILTSQNGTDGLISRFIVERDEFYTGFTPMNREDCGFNRAMCEVIGNAWKNYGKTRIY